jgi:class 3 adenylate cyclase
VSTYRPKPSDYQQLEIRGKSVKILAANTYNSFDISLLGLGDVSQPSTSADAIAAIFDLQGFTAFCRQIEPHLSVPLFLSNFLEWLLDEIKREMTKQRFETGATLWCPLPFFLKFMGDGLLVLWDSSGMADSGRRNVIVSAYEICEKYKAEFLPHIAKQVAGPPAILRCGLARGTVYSVGSDSDFVGSCINMSSRIQKLAGTTFAFNRRGFNLEDPDTATFFTHDVIIRKTAVRGIGSDELIAILKSEYDAMSEEDRKQFCEP